MMLYLMQEAAVRTTVTLDDDLVRRAQELTGRDELSAIVRLSLETLVTLEAGRRLARMGGSDAGASAGRRRRSPAE